MSQLSTVYLNSIATEILSKYIRYKSQQYNSILYKALIIYSKKEVKLLSSAFKKLRGPRFAKLNKLKQQLIPQSNFNVYYEEPGIKRSSRGRFLNKSQSVGNISSNPNKSICNSQSNSNITNFIQRQEKYHKQQNISKERILKDSEEEYNLICTFNPKIVKNPNVKNYYTQSQQSAHVRLYKDSIERQNRKNEIEKVASRLRKKGKVDKGKFEQLYEDYKVRKENHKKLITQLDEERGYTFVPDISHRGIGNNYMEMKRIKENKKNEENNRSVIIGGSKKDFSFIYEYIQKKKQE